MGCYPKIFNPESRVIHSHIVDNGYIVGYQEQWTHGWRGEIKIDIEPTKENFQSLTFGIIDDPEKSFEINKFFPEYDGQAYVTFYTKIRPIIIRFQGIDLLKKMAYVYRIIKSIFQT